MRPDGPEQVSWRSPLAFARFLKAFGDDPLAFVRGRFERYGDTYFTVSTGDPLYVTRDLDVIRDVLIHRPNHFEKRTEDLDFLLGQGLLTSDGERWRRHRRMIQPAFGRDRLRRYCDVFSQRARAWTERNRAGDVIDLQAEMTSLTLDVVCRALFDHDVEGDTERAVQAIDAIQDGMGVFVPDWLPTPAKVRQWMARPRLASAMTELIESKRRAPGPDLLSELLRIEDSQGGLSSAEVRDHLVTLYTAGHETTALALTWTLHLLAGAPDAAARLHSELDALDTDTPSHEHLDSLEWTGWCIDEAMRLFPPAYALTRRTVRRTMAGPWSLVPGNEVVIWIYHLHRDPRHFDTPESFRPERFSRASSPAYMPFGAGQRTCIGRHFARMEAKLILATVARRFRFVALEPNLPVGTRPRITLGPNRPLRYRLEDRAQARPAVG